MSQIDAVPQKWLEHRNYMQAQMRRGETFLSFREWSAARGCEHAHTATSEYEHVYTSEAGAEFEMTSHTICLDCGAELPGAEPVRGAAFDPSLALPL